MGACRWIMYICGVMHNTRMDKLETNCEIFQITEVVVAVGWSRSISDSNGNYNTVNTYVIFGESLFVSSGG